MVYKPKKNVNVKKGLQGFQPTTKGKKVPTSHSNIDKTNTKNNNAKTTKQNDDVTKTYERFQHLTKTKTPIADKFTQKQTATNAQQKAFHAFVYQTNKPNSPYMQPSKNYVRATDDNWEPPPDNPPPASGGVSAVRLRRQPKIHLDSDYNNATSGDRNKTTDNGRMAKSIKSDPNHKNASPQTPPGYRKFNS